MNPEKAFLIGLSAAVGMGIGGALTAGGYEALANVAMDRQHTVAVELGAGAASTFENFLSSNMCAQFQTDFDAGAGDCTVDLWRQSGVCQQWNSETSKWEVRSTVVVPGTWVLGSP